MVTARRDSVPFEEWWKRGRARLPPRIVSISKLVVKSLGSGVVHVCYRCHQDVCGMRPFKADEKMKDVELGRKQENLAKLNEAP